MMMDPKKHLRSLRAIENKIRQKMEEKNKLQDAASSISGASFEEQVQHTGTGSRSEDIICRYIDLEREIDAAIDEYVNLKDKIINQIHQIEDPDMMTVLYERYVNHRSFEEIARLMRYSIRWVYKKHNDGMQEFEKLSMKSVQ